MKREAHAHEGCYNPAPMCDLMGQYQQLLTGYISYDQVTSWTSYRGFNHCFNNTGHQTPMEVQEGSTLPAKSWNRLELAYAM